MNRTDDFFMQLMRIALGNQCRLDAVLTSKEWAKVINISKKQSVEGVMYCGVEKLPKEQQPPFMMLLKWYKDIDKYEKENLKMNAMCVEACRICLSEGINACVLKGQGVGSLYEFPLRRVSGDIDLWMEGGRDRVVSYIKKNFRKVEVLQKKGHHISVPLCDGAASMEVHYLPAELHNQRNFKILKQWFDEIEQQQWHNFAELRLDNGKVASINVPTPEFNQV